MLKTPEYEISVSKFWSKRCVLSILLIFELTVDCPNVSRLIGTLATWYIKKNKKS